MANPSIFMLVYTTSHQNLKPIVETDLLLAPRTKDALNPLMRWQISIVPPVDFEGQTCAGILDNRYSELVMLNCGTDVTALVKMMKQDVKEKADFCMTSTEAEVEMHWRPGVRERWTTASVVAHYGPVRKYVCLKIIEASSKG